MCPLVSNVRETHERAARNLSLDRQIELLCVRKMIAVGRPVCRAVSVVGALADVRRFAVSGEAVVQVERGLVAAVRIAKANGRIEAVQADATAPTWIEGLRVEKPVAGAYNGLVVDFVCGTEARTVSAVEHLLGVRLAEAGRAPIVAGVHQAAGKTPCSRVWSKREERRMVAGFPRGREPVPAEAIVDRELVRYLTDIAHVPGIGSLFRAILVDVVNVQVAIVHSSNDEAGVGVAARCTRQSGVQIVKTRAPGLVAVDPENLLQMPEFTAEFDFMRSVHPGDHVIDNVRWPRALVQLAQTSRLAPRIEVAVSGGGKAGLRGSGVGNRVRNLRNGLLRGNGTIAFVAVYVTVGHVVQQRRAEDMIPVEPAHPGIFRICGVRIANLQR